MKLRVRKENEQKWKGINKKTIIKNEKVDMQNKSNGKNKEWKGRD